MMSTSERFTETVDHYLKYRPSYPKEILQVLREECQLTPETIIADIGSGTGFLSKLLLDAKCTVFGIEPNDAMRTAGEAYLQNYSRFYSIPGTAEKTSLVANSIDLITAGTAFHWFNPEASKQEFQRILKSPGYVFLTWNVRDMNTPLIKEYEELIIQYGKDYLKSSAQKFNHTVGENFFAPYEMRTKSFVNIQQFDWEGFQGRLHSTSYAQRPGDKAYEAMLSDLKKIFDRHQKNGMIDFAYLTKIYYGRFK